MEKLFYEHWEIAKRVDAPGTPGVKSRLSMLKVWLDEAVHNSRYSLAGAAGLPDYELAPKLYVNELPKRSSLRNRNHLRRWHVEM